MGVCRVKLRRKYRDRSDVRTQKGIYAVEVFNTPQIRLNKLSFTFEDREVNWVRTLTKIYPC